MLKLLLVILIIISSFSLQAYAKCDNDTIQIFYTRGYGIIEPEFKGNAHSLSRLDSLLNTPDTHPIVEYFVVTPNSSPDGSISANGRLMVKRAALVKRHLESVSSQPLDIRIQAGKLDNYGEVYALTLPRTDCPHHHEVMDCLRLIVQSQANAGVHTRQLIYKLRHIYEGKPYQWLYHNIFPLMRYTSIVPVMTGTAVYCPAAPQPVETSLAAAVPSEVAPLPEIPHLLTDPRLDASSVQPAFTGADAPTDAPREPRRNLYLGIRTNLLYDALLVPNIGLEYAFCRHWSIYADWAYAWWSNDSRHRYWRIYGGNLEARWWLGRKALLKPLQGHHIGLYAQMLTYDIEWGGKGYLGDKWTYGAGFSYGYSLPLSRRLNMDFSLGVGYLGGRYEEYVPMDGCYVWQATKNRHFLGVTKAEVSLVWLIGKGNINRKGGRK